MKKRGFTLIELLAVIVILAVIALIATPSILGIVDSVKKKTCSINTQMMEDSTYNYIALEGVSVNEGDKLTIPLKALTKGENASGQKYLKNIFDVNQHSKECTGYVEASKTNGEYDIKGHLICPSYCNNDEYIDPNLEPVVEENYFKGADPNNWVVFGRYDQSSSEGVLWRIVKSDDQGILLIYEGLENGGKSPIEDGRLSLNKTAGIAYNERGINSYTESTIKEKLEQFYQNIYVVNKHNYTHDRTYKIGLVPDSNPTFKETAMNFEKEKTIKSDIGLLTISDYMNASDNVLCKETYQSDGSSNPCSYTGSDVNNFLYKESYNHWTGTGLLNTDNKSWYINNAGQITSGPVDNSIISARPVLNLKKEVEFLRGTGTLADPYIIEDYMTEIKNGPMITLNGDSVISIREGEEYIEFGATALDPEEGDVSNQIEITSTVNVNRAGSYEVNYNVKNSNGRKAPMVTRSVIVKEKESPIIKLNGSNPTRIDINTNYTELGATAFDPYYGDISNAIKITGEVNNQQLGVYEIKYEVENKDGLKDEIIRKVIVNPTRPTITLNGESPQSIIAGESYIEFGANATDIIDGDITNRIQTKIIKYIEVIKDKKKIWEPTYSSILESNVDNHYAIEYQVTNNSGLTAKTVRPIVILPTDGPNITITPNASSNLKQKHEIQVIVTQRDYVIDNNSLKYVFINENQNLSNNFDLEKLMSAKFTNNGKITTPIGTGNYKLYVIAKDVYGNKTIQSSGYFKIDNSSPLLTLNGDSYLKLYVNQTYMEAGATAYDVSFDGDITSAIQITGEVDTAKQGRNVIKYSVSDSVGNKTEKSRIIEVTTPKPSIYLNGNRVQRILVNGSYHEEGASAIDPIDGNITNNIQITGTVDTSKEGTYLIKYEVQNSYGEKVSITRLVEVYVPNPIITINGDNPITIQIGTSYQDLGATATDQSDGNLTSKITTSSNLNPNKKGTYYVEYSVANSHAKTATVKRTVIVDAPKPTITLNGNNNVMVYKNEIYHEQGAVAADEIDGDLTSKIKINGTVDPSKNGVYRIVYTVLNRYGEKAETTRYVEVRDYIVTIELLGNNPYSMKVTDKYSEPGYKVMHEKNGDITSDVKVTSNVDEGKIGRYTIEYRYQDSVTGQVEKVQRTVVVETPKLTLTLNGSSPYLIYAGNGYFEQGATAVDEIDGNITEKIVITTDVNPNRVGTYTTTYKVISNYGVEQQISRITRVLAHEGPNINFTVNGNNEYKEIHSTGVSITKNKADLVEESYYLWKDDLTMPKEDSFFEKLSHNQELTTPTSLNGKYYLWILAKDVTGSSTIKASNAFYLDNAAPVIKLNGNRVIEIPIDSVYKELGATVNETGSGLTNDGLRVTSNVNPSQFGTYQVTYDAEDKLGHKAASVTRIVTVVESKLIDVPDKDTESKYYSEYFVGSNPNNWILFGNASNNEIEYIPIYFRIVKMDSEGIKIIYEGTKDAKGKIVQDGSIMESEFGSSNYDVSTLKVKLEDWYNNIKDVDKEKLTTKINWCVGKVNIPYTTDKFKNEECSLKSSTSAVGLLTGGDYLSTTKNPCTAYNQSSCGINNFLKKSYNYFTLSGDVVNTDYLFEINKNGALTRKKSTEINRVRPVINLKSNVLIAGGDGTFENPYKLNTREPLVDTEKPVITFDQSTYSTNSDQAGVIVSVMDAISGVDPNSLKYIWSTSATVPNETSFSESFSNGEKIVQPQEGKYYLFVLAKDRIGNTAIVRSGLYTLDRTAPVVTIKGDNPLILYKNSSTYTDPGITATDNITGSSSLITTVVSDIQLGVSGIYTVTYTVSDAVGNTTVAVRTVDLQNSYLFNYTGTYSTINLDPGSYIFQLWGAQGERNTGKGGYSEGKIKLTENQTFYIYVGGITIDYNSNRYCVGGWNGGGSVTLPVNGVSSSRAKCGGGATDIRTVPGLWNDSASLNSRIIVAGGGGGSSSSSYGGGITSGGYSAATQTKGNRLGIGCSSTYHKQAAGGGGYYGGYCSVKVNDVYMLSSGGSGFVPGHEGVVESKNGYTFSDTVMTPGINSSSGKVIIIPVD